MNEHKLQYYSKYRHDDLQREGQNERLARQAIGRNRTAQAKRKPKMTLLIHLINLIRGI